MGRNQCDRRQPDKAVCRLEPVIRAMAPCPSELRACMLWAIAFRLAVVPDDEQASAFACVLKAIEGLPAAQRVQPLAELGLHIPDLPDIDQPGAFHAFVGAISDIPAELRVEPLTELAFRMVEQAYLPGQPDVPDHPLLH